MIFYLILVVCRMRILYMPADLIIFSSLSCKLIATLDSMAVRAERFVSSLSNVSFISNSRRKAYNITEPCTQCIKCILEWKQLL